MVGSINLATLLQVWDHESVCNLPCDLLFFPKATALRIYDRQDGHIALLVKEKNTGIQLYKYNSRDAIFHTMALMFVSMACKGVPTALVQRNRVG